MFATVEVIRSYGQRLSVSDFNRVLSFSASGSWNSGKATRLVPNEGLGSFGGQVLALLCEFLGRRLVNLFLLGNDLILPIEICIL